MTLFEQSHQNQTILIEQSYQYQTILFEQSHQYQTILFKQSHQYQTILFEQSDQIVSMITHAILLQMLDQLAVSASNKHLWFYLTIRSTMGSVLKKASSVGQVC